MRPNSLYPDKKIADPAQTLFYVLRVFGHDQVVVAYQACCLARHVTWRVLRFSRFDEEQKVQTHKRGKLVR